MCTRLSLIFWRARIDSRKDIEPDLGRSEQPPPIAYDLEPRKYRLSRDIVEETATVEYEVHYSPQWTHSASISVSAKHPALCSVNSRSERNFLFDGQKIDVAASCETWSNETSFQHTTTVEISVNGRPYFTRSWSESSPRLCA